MMLKRKDRSCPVKERIAKERAKNKESELTNNEK